MVQPVGPVTGAVEEGLVPARERRVHPVGLVEGLVPPVASVEEGLVPAA